MGNRSVSAATTRPALTIALLAVMLVASTTIVVELLSGFSFAVVLFECTSAFATVGLSTGITADLKHALTFAYTGGEVLCAAWAEHTIVGTQPAVSIHGKNYVWWLDGEDSGDFPARWPHVLMDTLGRWAISLDIDSMSHYVGVLGTRAVRWPVGRERTEVSPDDRLN